MSTGKQQYRPRQQELTDDDILERVIQATERAKDASVANIVNLDDVRRSFAHARAVRDLRAMLTDDIIEAYFVPLLGDSELGIGSDRSKGDRPQYTAAQMRTPIITAMMWGARFYGGEWMILCDRCYLMRPYFERVVPRWPGVSDWRFTAGIPQFSGQDATIRIAATWKFNGVEDRIIDAWGKDGMNISIRVNKGQGPAAVTGKAYRQGHAIALKRIMNCELDIDLDLEPGAPDGPPADSLGAERLKPQGGPTTPTLDPESEVITADDADGLRDFAASKGIRGERLRSMLQAQFQTDRLEELKPAEADQFQIYLEELPADE